jgi:DNA-3-methyladenine glycosylase I
MRRCHSESERVIAIQPDPTLPRCAWAKSSEQMMHYHDTYWGVPVHDDQELFAKLVLDMNQAGLSWATILRKQENFYAAYDHFDIETVANYDESKVKTLLQNPGIIRNKSKINAAITAAKCIQEIQQEFGSFDSYIWSFTNGQTIQHHYPHDTDVPANSALSDTISTALRKRGFKFAGTTIIYAYLQAIGVVNDHVQACFRYGNNGYHEEINLSPIP